MMDPVIKEFRHPAVQHGWFQPVQIAIGVDSMNLLACPGEEPTTA